MGLTKFLEKKIAENRAKRQEEQSQRQKIDNEAKAKRWEGYRKGAEKREAERGYREATQDNSFTGKLSRAGSTASRLGNDLFEADFVIGGRKSGGFNMGGDLMNQGSDPLGMFGGDRKAPAPKGRTTTITTGGKRIIIKDDAPVEKKEKKPHGMWDDVEGW
jgi:hypothetical protein